MHHGVVPITDLRIGSLKTRSWEPGSPLPALVPPSLARERPRGHDQHPPVLAGFSFFTA